METTLLETTARRGQMPRQWYSPRWTAADTMKARRNDIALDAAPRSFTAQELDFVGSYSLDKPYVSNGPREHGSYRLTKEYAFRKRFVQPTLRNGPNLLVLDVDRQDAATYIKSLAYDRDDDGPSTIPEPNFIVTNPGSGHAHVVYLLHGFIGTAAGHRFLEHVYARLVAVTGADPAYTQGLMRNPIHFPSETDWLTDRRYTLEELNAGVAEDVHPQQTIARQRSKPFPADTDLISLFGRNTGTFESVRAWAYRAWINNHKDGFENWETLVGWFTHERHAYLIPDERRQLGRTELDHIARHIAKWVWSRFDERTFRAIQKNRSDRAAAKRTSEAMERWSNAIAMQEAGMTRREIGEQLGKTNEQVRDLLHRARKGLAKNAAEQLEVGLATVTPLELGQWEDEPEFALAS